MVALDLAIHTGVAIYKKNTVNIYEIVNDNPITQLDNTIKLFPKGTKEILIEDYVYFAKSKKTVSSLLKRLGYFEYTLFKFNFNVELVHPQTYQWYMIKEFNLSDKLKKQKGSSKKKMVINKFLSEYYGVELTDNMTD
ncbi:MAG: hypothetical protein KDH96_03950, partial [Candidatus Riesia sp.]|nr:hypothetical protein [Candidatus Riesia sp.]